MKRLFPAGLLALLVAVGAGGVVLRSAHATQSGKTLKVPSQFPTIQKAVSAANPGDLVLIAAGRYRESVLVNTPRIVIRGADRNAVVVDGEFKRDDGFRVIADGVAIENLTVRGYLLNGLLFTGAFLADGSTDSKQTPLIGYRASYVTAANNALYGFYAFVAQQGQFDHDYASGNADSGYYVGQCRKCAVVVSDSIGERNAVGYENTDASDGIAVVRSIWRRNRVGVAINSQDTELLAPSVGVTIVGNRVEHNNNPKTPETAGAFGVGIVVAAGVKSTVARNRVTANGALGIAVTDLDHYLPLANRVEGNIVTGHESADLAAFLSGQTPGKAEGNCFSRNRFARSFPAKIETTLSCTRSAASLPVGRPRLAPPPPAFDYRRVPAPPQQRTMPNAPSAPVRPAVGLGQPLDVSKIPVPK